MLLYSLVFISSCYAFLYRERIKEVTNEPKHLTISASRQWSLAGPPAFQVRCSFFAKLNWWKFGKKKQLLGSSLMVELIMRDLFCNGKVVRYFFFFYFRIEKENNFQLQTRRKKHAKNHSSHKDENFSERYNWRLFSNLNSSTFCDRFPNSKLKSKLEIGWHSHSI